MLVIHDDKGEITQVLFQHELPLDELAKRYAAEGRRFLLAGGNDQTAIFFSYVRNGQLVPKPDLRITGEDLDRSHDDLRLVRALKADGLDTVTLSIAPGVVDIAVFFDGVIVHQESLTDGQLSFSVDHAGRYEIRLAPPFPYLVESLRIEAVA